MPDRPESKTDAAIDESDNSKTCCDENELSLAKQYPLVVRVVAGPLLVIQQDLVADLIIVQ